MDIVFLISHLPNPRMNKRIEVGKKAGTTSLIYWDRGTVEIWDIFHKDISNYKIRILAAYTNPLKRIFPTIKYGIQAIKQLRKLKPKILYVANVDMLLIANIYSFITRRKTKIIYEIADLNKLVADKQISLVSKFASKVLITLEKKLTKKIDTLVVTSEKFYHSYYAAFISQSKVLFIPNMPDIKYFQDFSRKDNGTFTVGFIGAVRYKNQMKMLINAAEECGINLLFAGAGLDDEIENLVKDKPFVKYIGKYNYEQEIANLYGQVDAIYSVYDADLKNVRVALPNKLYESIYCELPIIVAQDTYLSEIVESEGIGISINHNNQKQLTDAIRRLANDIDYYNSFVNACNSVKEKINIKIYNDKLFERLSK